jgi:NAD(P)-dependent dehydrogenase (short-subunit alcohol dehydrogenase family)
VQKIVEEKEIDAKGKFALEGWVTGKVSPHAGRFAVVTGGGGGLGYEIALALATESVDLIIAELDEGKGRAAAAKIRSLAPKALVRFEKLDLADLASVTAFADRMISEGRPLDLLVNSASVMALPKRSVTADGFEMQFGTNYLGHFALTMQLLPLLRMSKSPRVVQVSSLAYRYGKIRLNDLQARQNYRPWAAYWQSKLALVVFALELQRQSDARGWGLLSSAVHPGYTQTELIANGQGARSMFSRWSRAVGKLISQSAADGALPALFAATSEDALPGGFYGPGGRFELTGPPVAANLTKSAKDEAIARNLWQISEQLTGVKSPTE